MKHLDVGETDISCGIHTVFGFEEFGPYDAKGVKKDLVEAIKDLFHPADDYVSAEMILCSLNEHQWANIEPLIKEVGFKQVGRTHTNRNSGNKIRLYLLQHGDEKLP